MTGLSTELDERARAWDLINRRGGQLEAKLYHLVMFLVKLRRKLTFVSNALWLIIQYLSVKLCEWGQTCLRWWGWVTVNMVASELWRCFWVWIEKDGDSWWNVKQMTGIWNHRIDHFDLIVTTLMAGDKVSLRMQQECDCMNACWGDVVLFWISIAFLNSVAH